MQILRFGGETARLEGPDGRSPSWGRALLRFATAILSWLPLGLGYLWVLADRDRRVEAVLLPPNADLRRGSFEEIERDAEGRAVVRYRLVGGDGAEVRATVRHWILEAPLPVLRRHALPDLEGYALERLQPRRRQQFARRCARST